MVTIGQRRLAQRGRSSWPCACARRDAACDLRSLCVRTRTAVAGLGRRARDLRGTRGRRSSNPTWRSPPCSAAALISRTAREEAARRGQYAPPDAPGRPDRAGRRPPPRSSGVDRRRDRDRPHLGRIRLRGVGRSASARGRGGRGRRPCRDPLRGPGPRRRGGRRDACGRGGGTGGAGGGGRGCRPLRAPGAGGRRAGVRGRHRSRSARSGRARRAAGRGRRGRGPRPAAAHLRRPGRVPVAPRGAGQPGPGSRVASGPGHARGPRVADPAPLPRLRAGSRSVPGLLGRGDRRAARSWPARRRRPWPMPSSGIG